MKKILTLLLGLVLGLALIGCGSKTTETTTVSTTQTTTEATLDYSTPLKVIAPNGAPALSQIYAELDANYDVEVVNGADLLAAAFGSESHDFIYAPTNLGAKLYNSGIQYKLAAAVTFGNYYLVSSQENFTLASLEGQEIVVFGQNATSDIILRYILEQNNITATLTYVASAGDANAEFVLDSNKIILSAEPLLSVMGVQLAAQSRTFNTIDLQAEYMAITGEDSYPQAGVFVKADLDSEYVEAYLTILEASVNTVNNDIEQTITQATALGYTFPGPVLTTAIPRSNIGFVRATEIKSDLEDYFNIILEMNSALIGGQLPDDDFYF